LDDFDEVLFVAVEVLRFGLKIEGFDVLEEGFKETAYNRVYDTLAGVKGLQAHQVVGVDESLNASFLCGFEFVVRAFENLNGKEGYRWDHMMV